VVRCLTSIDTEGTQEGFTDPGAISRGSASDPRHDGKGPVAFDLINVDDVLAVQHAQVDGLLCVLVQFNQEWVSSLTQRHPTQLLAAQLQDLDSQVIATIAVILNVSHIKKGIDITVNASFMDPDPLCQLDRG